MHVVLGQPRLIASGIVFLVVRRQRSFTLFPYTTLFRSRWSWWSASMDPARRPRSASWPICFARSEEHTSELQSRGHLVCRLLLEKKNPPGTDAHLHPTRHPAHGVIPARPHPAAPPHTLG